MRIGDWYGIDVCVKCHKELTDNQRYYSKGICPFCGESSNSTIVDTMKVVLRKVEHHPWWRFWNKHIEYMGVDRFSERWANPDKYKIKKDSDESKAIKED